MIFVYIVDIYNHFAFCITRKGILAGGIPVTVTLVPGISSFRQHNCKYLNQIIGHGLVFNLIFSKEIYANFMLILCCHIKHTVTEAGDLSEWVMFSFG